VAVQQHGLPNVGARVVDHRPAAHAGTRSLVRRHLGDKLVQDPALQRAQPRMRHFQQAPATGALGQQLVAIVLLAQRGLALPRCAAREAPQPGRRDAQALGERTDTGPQRPVHRSQAGRRIGERGRNRSARPQAACCIDHDGFAL